MQRSPGLRVETLENFWEKKIFARLVQERFCVASPSMNFFSCKRSAMILEEIIVYGKNLQ